VNSGPVLSQGSTGADVRRVQRILVMVKLMDYTGIDGIFGPKTKQSVKSFQEGEGLAVDGIVGPATWGAMPDDPNTPQLAHGAHGATVKALQKGLRVYNGAGTPTDPGPLDGIFGSRTESAVRHYQSEHGVGVDGIVGDRTWWVPAGGAGATLASLSQLTTELSPV
jgi:peptidoglycan hydrolase-like protein with peptidoglycan-binding domain